MANCIRCEVKNDSIQRFSTAIFAPGRSGGGRASGRVCCNPSACRASSVSYTRAAYTDTASYPNSDADTIANACADTNTCIHTQAVANSDIDTNSSGHGLVCSAGPR